MDKTTAAEREQQAHIARTYTPGVKQAFSVFDLLTDEERLTVYAWFCSICGKYIPPGGGHECGASSVGRESDTALRDDESAFLVAFGRCEVCEHFNALHDEENDECRIDACDCGFRKWRRHHESAGHALTHVLPSAVTSERYNCSCFASYEVDE